MPKQNVRLPRFGAETRRWLDNVRDLGGIEAKTNSQDHRIAFSLLDVVNISAPRGPNSEWVRITVKTIPLYELN